MCVYLKQCFCNQDVKIYKFREYPLKMLRHFVKLYPWYNMPPTLQNFFLFFLLRKHEIRTLQKQNSE